MYLACLVHVSQLKPYSHMFKTGHLRGERPSQIEIIANVFFHYGLEPAPREILPMITMGLGLDWVTSYPVHIFCGDKLSSSPSVFLLNVLINILRCTLLLIYCYN